MSKKTDRALHGPSWTEVILGAFLSLILGIVIGATLLILRPPVIAKEEPKERERGVVYYIEGSKDSSKAKQAAAKKQAFVAGQSVTVTEEEVNALLAPAAAPAPGAAKGAEKGKEKKDGKEAEAAPAASDGYFTAGAPNVRIREGAVQVSVPVTIGLIDQKVIAQAKGGFVKQGDIFVYEPETMYLGSCPVERLPLVAGLVRDKVLASQSIPEDVVAAWKKLANVTVEGNAVKLTMP